MIPRTIELNQLSKTIPQLKYQRQNFYLIVKNKKPLFHLIPFFDATKKKIAKLKKELENTNLYTAHFIQKICQSEKEILNQKITSLNSLKELTN